ncbi:uncharacterized protein L199_004564 [Kwoniella botswanensis]|uniref:uncharacterized protein n=1 Tax=Kwoniella botswanensis TaxID=1268659 RepID=UPI00315CED17
MIPFWKPAPAPAAAFKGQSLPYRDASFFSRFFLNWAGPSIRVAWSRGLEADDLYDLTPELHTRLSGDTLESHYMRRVPPAFRPEKYKATGSAESRSCDRSLFKAICHTVWKSWWFMVMVKLVALALRAYVPLVMKDLLTQISRAQDWYHGIAAPAGTDGLMPPASVGYMLAIGLGIWAMIFGSSSLLYIANWRIKLTGKLLNSALTCIISRKAMRLSGRSKLRMTDGRITTMVSVDTAFIEAAVDQSTEIICTPAQIIASLSFLLWELGWSGLVGLGVILLVIPLKAIIFKRISKIRRMQNEVVDERVRLLSEVLHNIRAVKLYAYESCFGQRISDMRANELKRFRSNNIIASGLSALMSFIPTLAAISTFIVYALMGHKLDAAIIFSSLQYFNNLKNPISYIPQVLTTLSQATTGIARINELLLSEELDRVLKAEPSCPFAIDAQGDFQFEDLFTKSDELPKIQQKAAFIQAFHVFRKLFERNTARTGYIRIDGQPSEPFHEASVPFSILDIDLKIPRGALTCIVGRVGTGKTSLLSALVNEMKQVKGHTRLGGSISYVPQQAWVQSGSIRDNITFFADSQDVDLRRVAEVIDACGLRSDVEAWPDKELTIIGERGVTLSGGQRQRLSIARAAYEQSDIVLLDDPLSAVDAHVAHHLLDQCVLEGPMAGRTRVLVTHHLDVLPHADLVLVMDRDQSGNGRIIQKGRYEDLVKTEGVFKTLIQQYGTPIGRTQPTASIPSSASSSTIAEAEEESTKPESSGKVAQSLIMEEEKSQGNVPSRVYRNYIASIRSYSLITLSVCFLLIAQAASALNTLFLGYWSENRFANLSKKQYMGIYAGLGIAMAIFTWASIFIIFVAGIRASFYMFDKAWNGVMRSPTSWHDRTPTGRIINRLSKDIEILDDRIASTWYNVFSATLTIIGAIALVLYTYPVSALVFIPILYFDYMAVMFFLEISRDINRLVSNLRSQIYTNLGEQLAGMSVIRAFKRQDRFQQILEGSIDVHLVSPLGLKQILTGLTLFNAIVSSLNKRVHSSWLHNRVRFVSELSVLAVIISGITFRESVSSAKFGVVLSYVMLSTSTLGRLVGSLTEAIISMNTVERVQYYTELPSEAPRQLPSDPNADSWPSRGKITFRDVSMKYRPELPLVLKDVNFTVQPGERVGIIGRTGSGKSTLVQVLFRLVEIDKYNDEVSVDGNRGRVEIDGVDIRSLGLDTLRRGLSIIPQDPFLFSGTIRENIDPQGVYTDAELNDSLNLIERDSRVSTSLKEKMRLDYMVVNQGTNFSAGERQLIALIRAIVEKSKILILDEATSSVDLETDSLIQKIVQNEFSGVTLLSIAHRIQTVINYDKILIMEQGRVVDFDTPSKLYNDPQSIFRKLCDRSLSARHRLNTV